MVCICIPNFNNICTISETLDSLTRQTYSNLIIKVFDNVSNDGSWEVIQKYSDKYSNIFAFQNNSNIGAEANFTECIKGLEGEYGAIYHADDLYHSSMVEEQVECLMSNNISAVFVKADIINSQSEIVREQFFPTTLKETYYQFDFKKLFTLILMHDNFLITPSVMARVDLYKNKIKSWNGSKFYTSADLDVWLRFSEIQDIGIITKKLMSYRLSESSYSYRNKITRVTPRDMFLVLDFYIEKYKYLNLSLSDYKFLKFKDNLIVSSNKLLNGKNIACGDLELLSLPLTGRILRSQKKIFIILYAIMLNFLLCIRLRSVALTLVNLASRSR